ncbi:MAG: alpha/beta hydrolase [Pseudomonadota bacterium]
MTQMTPRLSKVPSQRLNLAVAEWGPEDAPPLVFVHGGRDQKRSWDWVIHRLADRHRIITYDLRGHGDSDRTNDGGYSVMDHVYDLASIVDHFQLETFDLVGHSLGGNIALRYAGIFPDQIRTLTSMEGLGPSPRMLEERLAVPLATRLGEWVQERRKISAREPRKMASLDEAKQRMRARFDQLSDAQIDHLSATGIRELPDGSVRWAYDPAAIGRTPTDLSVDDWQTLWGNISCPVWLVYGADSWASDPSKDGRADYFKDAQVTVFENAGHWLHHDQLDSFIQKLVPFLDSSAR